MSEQNGVPGEQSAVSPQDFLLMIGELVVENRLLRARLEAFEQATQEEKKEEVRAGN